MYKIKWKSQVILSCVVGLKNVIMPLNGKLKWNVRIYEHFYSPMTIKRL